MNKKLIALSASVLLAVMPLAAMAAFNAGPIPNQTAAGFGINNLVDIIFAILWPVFVAFAIFMFIMAAFQFFNSGGDAEKVAGARNSVIYGVIGIVVALLAFSIPFIVRTTVGL